MSANQLAQVLPGLLVLGLGVGMVFIRTRYAVAVYLVFFGSIIVAAFKMGMVHERPHVGPAQGLDAPGTATTTATIERATVFEIEEAREIGGGPNRSADPADQPPHAAPALTRSSL